MAFTNIPMQETINIYVDILFEDKTCIDSLTIETCYLMANIINIIRGFSTKIYFSQ